VLPRRSLKRKAGEKNPLRLYALIVEKSDWWRFLHRGSHFFAWMVIINERKKMNTKIYVGNIPSQTTEPDLKTLFSQAGDVISVKILKDHQTGQSRGFAFVEMSTRKEARKAVSMLNRRSFMDKEILVKEARVRREFRGRRW
jgi:RNA recognition motif-containing protein